MIPVTCVPAAQSYCQSSSRVSRVYTHHGCYILCLRGEREVSLESGKVGCRSVAVTHKDRCQERDCPFHHNRLQQSRNRTRSDTPCQSNHPRSGSCSRHHRRERRSAKREGSEGSRSAFLVTPRRQTFQKWSSNTNLDSLTDLASVMGLVQTDLYMGPKLVVGVRRDGHGSAL